MKTTKITISHSKKSTKGLVTKPRIKPATTKSNVSKKAILKKAAVANHQLVVPLGNGWVVKSINAKTFTAITETKQAAISIATAIAKQKRSDIVIHSKAGKFIERKSYANKIYDPVVGRKLVPISTNKTSSTSRKEQSTSTKTKRG
jgi:hypothetical protein